MVCAKVDELNYCGAGSAQCTIKSSVLPVYKVSDNRVEATYCNSPGTVSILQQSKLATVARFLFFQSLSWPRLLCSFNFQVNA